MTDELSGLSEQARRALALEGIISYRELTTISRTALKRLPGIGPRRLREIAYFLDEKNDAGPQPVDQAIINIILDHVGQARAAACAARVAAWLRDAGPKKNPGCSTTVFDLAPRRRRREGSDVVRAPAGAKQAF
jgi:hypothetical protein